MTIICFRFHSRSSSKDTLFARVLMFNPDKNIYVGHPNII